MGKITLDNIHVLMINAYSFPERIAFSDMEMDLYRELSSLGMQIDVVTPTPTRGITQEVYQKYRKVKDESMFSGSVRFHRYALMRESKNLVLRGFRYVIGNIKSYFKSKTFRNADVLFATSTPPTQGMLCSFIKKSLKIPFIYYLCDVFPDSLVNTGITSKKSLLYKIGQRIENYTYENADHIIVVSEDVKNNIISKGVPESKISVVYNWIDTNTIVNVPRHKNTLFDEFGLDRNKFYVVYAGNLGAAQNVEKLVHVAQYFRNSNIEFVIFGNGTEEQKLVGLSSSLENVHIFPMQPNTRISEVYSMGNIDLVICKPGFGSGGLPSKTWAIMATETPVLLHFDTETDLCNIVTKNSCGVFVPNDDFEGLADAIQKLSHMDEVALRLMGKNAHAFVTENMSVKKCVNRIISIISNVVDIKNGNKHENSCS